MTQDLKIKIQIGNQPMMVWEVLNKEQKYTRFKASITAGKKQPDGNWINISQTFTCFVFGDVKNKFDSQVQPRQRIKIWGNISMLPEKTQDPNSNFSKTFFSKAQINIDKFEIIQNTTQNNNQKSSLEDTYFKISKGY